MDSTGSIGANIQTRENIDHDPAGGLEELYSNTDLVPHIREFWKIKQRGCLCALEIHRVIIWANEGREMVDL